MGLKQKSASTTYLTIINGKITKKASIATPGAIERVNKMNETVYELHFDSLTGMVKKIDTKDGDYGKQWLITITDNLDDFMIQIPFSGRYANGFLKRLPNIDLNNEIEIKTGVFQEKPYLSVYQNGQKVPYYFTKETPHGLPEMEQVMVKGKPQWDDSKMLLWLENYVAEEITPKLKDKYELPTDTVSEHEEDTNTTQTSTAQPPQVSDDLPF